MPNKIIYAVFEWMPTAGGGIMGAVATISIARIGEVAFYALIGAAVGTLFGYLMKRSFLSWLDNYFPPPEKKDKHRDGELKNLP